MLAVEILRNAILLSVRVQKTVKGGRQVLVGFSLFRRTIGFLLLFIRISIYYRQRQLIILDSLSTSLEDKKQKRDETRISQSEQKRNKKVFTF